MTSIPAALIGFREYNAPNTSASEMLVETRLLVMDESRASASGGKVTLLVVNMERKKLFNSAAIP